MIVHLSDAQGRNAGARLISRRRKQVAYLVDKRLRPAVWTRLVKGSLPTNYPALSRRFKAAELAQALIDGDPELDLELFGMRVQRTRKLYLNAQEEPVNRVRLIEEHLSPNGKILRRRQVSHAKANINEHKPLRLGRPQPKRKTAAQLALRSDLQLVHEDGAGYDFLHRIAADLEQQNALAPLLGADGAPLVLGANYKPRHAFLEGRTQNDAYLLILHLADLELKPLPRIA